LNAIPSYGFELVFLYARTLTSTVSPSQRLIQTIFKFSSSRFCVIYSEAMRRSFGIFAFLIIVVATITGGLARKGITKSFVSTGISPTEKISEDYQAALSVIDDYYAGSPDYEKLAQTSIQGMLWTLDPHSSFFTYTEFQKLKEDQSSSFYGIGVSILQHADGVYVQAVVEKTPAAKAGLRYGDHIVEVDGKDARKWTSSEVSRNVRGTRGVPVKIKIERAGEPKPLELEIVRDAVPLPSIRNFFMIRPGIGYVGLTGGFQSTTDEELGDAITKLKEQGMQQLILDLRGNPGGILGQAISVASRFIPHGKVIASVKGRTEYAEPEYHESKSERVEDFPLVVLINHNSASASEIVSGAIQDHGRGKIIGQRSFGKGLVQKVFQLPLGTGLTLTTARYYTPYGRSLQRDYSNGSIYDYYSNHDEEETSDNKPREQDNTNANVNTNATPTPTPSGPAVQTAGGRVFYGGGGITPDVIIKPTEFNALRSKIADAAFYFTRQLVAGQIAGLENYKITKTDHNYELRPTDYPITDQLLEAFRNFLNKDTLVGLKPSQIDSDMDFVKLRLREEIVTAAYGNENGNHVLLESDPQVLRAIEELPNAKRLSEAIRNGAQVG
jgi:carboxyl-terminal processing protease